MACRRNFAQAALACGGSIIAVLATLLAASAANAASLYVLDYKARNDPSVPFFTPVCNIKLQGQIQSGDYAKIEKQIEAFRKSPRRGGDPDDDGSNRFGGFYALCLSSDGGDIREALKIAELFTNWMRVVEADESCISACAILFMKVNRRDDPFKLDRRASGRYLHYRGKLGFHAPSLQVPAGSAQSLTAAGVENAYARALHTIGAIVFHDQVGLDPDPTPSPGDTDTPWWQTRDAVGILPTSDFLPQDLLYAFLTVPPKEVYFITKINEALNWGIEIYGFPPPRFISERMLLVACINVARSRCIYGGGNRQCLGSRHQPLHTDIDVPLDDEFFSQRVGYLKVTRSKLWPPAGRTSPYAQLGAKIESKNPASPPDDSDVPCAAKATFGNGRLLGLDLETFNSSNGAENIRRWFFRIEPSNYEAYLKSQLESEEKLFVNSDHLRPWKMLPANTKLKDLGTDPWAPLEKGGPFLAP